jgi:general secretion pathway protein N
MNGLFDTRRNLLTTLLIGGIGLLTVGGLGQAMFMGRVDVDRIPMSGAAGIGDSQVNAPETGLADFDEYTAITGRPVFFSDRRLPVVEVVEVDDEPPPPAAMPADDVEDLRAVIAGIIITPDLRMAMVRDEKMNRTVTLREGMSLEGEQAAWRLDTISPRMVSFVSVDGRNSELELKVNTAGLTAGSPGTIRTPITQRLSQPEQQPELDQDAAERRAENGEQVATPEEIDARTRAEEVRRRVAERRAELRAEAERRAQMQQQQRQDN